jgi:hypothetical protein
MHPAIEPDTIDVSRIGGTGTGVGPLGHRSDPNKDKSDRRRGDRPARHLAVCLAGAQCPRGVHQAVPERVVHPVNGPLAVTRLLQNPLGHTAPEGAEGDIVRISDGTRTIYLSPQEFREATEQQLRYRLAAEGLSR